MVWKKTQIMQFANNKILHKLIAGEKNCNCINKAKEKSQYECIVYKVEVYSCGPNNSNVSNNDKKYYVGSTQGPFKKDITIIEVLQMNSFINVREIKKNLGEDPILKWKIFFNWNHFEMRLLNLRINFLFIVNFLSSS